MRAEQQDRYIQKIQGVRDMRPRLAIQTCQAIIRWTRVLIWYQLGFSLGLPQKSGFGWDGASSDPKTVTLTLKILP